MVCNQLLALILSQLTQLVVLALKLASKRGKSSLSSSLYLVSIYPRDSRSKSVLLEVSADSDTGAPAHFCIILSTRWAVQFGIVHVAYMLIVFTVSVVTLYALVNQGRKVVTEPV